MNIVGIFDSNFKQVLTTSNPIRASVTPTAKVFSHPLENGSSINDHKIINPTEIELTLVLARGEYRSVYQEIKQLFYSDNLLSVQTHTDSYKDLVIERMPHEETPDVADTVIISVKLIEAFFAVATYGALPANMVRNVNQSSTINRGEQLPGSGGNSQGSFLYRQFFGNADDTPTTSP